MREGKGGWASHEKNSHHARHGEESVEQSVDIIRLLAAPPPRQDCHALPLLKSWEIGLSGHGQCFAALRRDRCSCQLPHAGHKQDRAFLLGTRAPTMVKSQNIPIKTW